jgi:hypothetical protein
MEYELHAWLSGINGVREGNQVQLASAQGIDNFNQVLGGAAQPVKLPDDGGVTEAS